VTVRLLDATDDRAEWLARWAEHGREPFAHPAYCESFAGRDDTAALAVVAYGGSTALVPLVLRGAGDLPWLRDPGRRYVDATSPYGYGGPFGPAVDLDPCLAALHDWAAGEGLGSVFLRLSLAAPGRPSRQRSDGCVVDGADNVVVDLRRTSQEIWAGYEHKVRKNVKKSLRLGCTVERDDAFTDLDTFLAVYSSTMTRRNAAAWYRFDRQFFATIATELRGSYSVFSTRDADGAVVSVELVLRSERFLYSFLGGTVAEAFPLAPNDLLKHTVIEHGRESGLEGFVLGGGATAGDGILRYKRSFCPEGVVPFRTAQLIPDGDRYARLVAQRRSWAPGPEDGSGFFPAYRTPVAR
jgi:CelD/BcsL family acetyltransferase involved in cellulose biosynthesis